MNQPLQTHLIQAGIFKEIVHSLVLPDRVAELLWPLQVIEAQTSTLPQRALWLFKVEVPSYQRALLSEAGAIKLGVGERLGVSSAQIRFIRTENRLALQGAEWICQLKGAVALVLPQTGLLSISGSRPAAIQRASVRSPGIVRLLRRDLKFIPLLRGGDSLELPLNDSTLQFSQLKGISVSPALDLANQVFKFGKTGVLMSFDSLVFTCQTGKPRFNFEGGKLWAVRGARS